MLSEISFVYFKMWSEWTKENWNQINSCFYLFAFKPASSHTNTCKKLVFFRVMVKCFISQSYQTGADDLQCHPEAETQSWTETETAVQKALNWVKNSQAVTNVRLWKTVSCHGKALGSTLDWWVKILNVWLQ